MPSQFTYKPDTDYNGTLHSHRVLSVLFLTSCAYHGNGTHAAYTYDAADRLVSAVGTGLSLSMTYSPAGRIGTKIQTSSGTNNTNTNCVYAYCNKIQPHAVRRVWSINDKVWHDFIYDANGNLAQHTRWGGNDDGSRSLYWTEDGRMFASVDESYVSLYGYDPSGERYSKIAAPSTVMDINAQERYVSAVAEDATIYPSPYVVASRYGYTKHIYAGADRVCTKIGSGGLDSLYQNNDSLLNNARTLAGKQLEYMPGRRIDAAPVDCNTKIDGTTGGDLTTHQTDKMSVQVDMVFRYEGLHSAMDDALTDHGTELHRYFYHPDHLGGASWVTNRNGHPIQHLQYLPYGETRLNQRTGIYNERYTFTGKEKDSETGYYYFGARYYNSDLSLWLSVDPMSDKYPSLSPYNYCAWNPMKLVDPDGKDIWQVDKSGQLKWKEESDVDRIVALNGSYVDVAEGILKRGISYTKDDGHFFLNFENNSDNATEVFEFLADNASVEFSLIGIAKDPLNDNPDRFYLSTSFQPDGDSFGSDYACRASSKNHMRSHTHNHPDDNAPITPSSILNNGSILVPFANINRGDDQALASYIKQGSPSCSFNIYHSSKGGEYRPYAICNSRGIPSYDYKHSQVSKKGGSYALIR